MLVSQIRWIAFKSPGSGRCSWFVASLSAIDSLINPHPHPTQVCLTQKSCDPLKSIVPYRLTAITALSVPVHLGTGLICSIWQQTRSQHLVCQWVRSREMMVDVDCQLAPRGRRRKEDGQAVIMARIYARNIRSDLALTATALILSKEQEYIYNYCCCIHRFLEFPSLRLPREFITSVSWTGFSSPPARLAQIWAKPGQSTFCKLARKSVQKLHLGGLTVTAANQTFLWTKEKDF